MNFNILTVIILINIISQPVWTQSDEGDPCVLRNSGVSGVCTFLSKCPTAIESLQKGVYPQICGFYGTQSIVCCGEGPKNPLPSPVPISTRTAGTISREKCKEYAKFVYDREPPAILLVDADEIVTKECPYEKIKLIVGGTPADRKEFPHMVQVGYGDEDNIQWRCGGTLISERFVLTAGHCLTSRDLGSAAFIRLGITNQTDLNNMQQRRITQRIPFTEYVTTAHYHDIALLKLDQNVDMNTYARPACLYTKKEPPKSRVIATGWGRLQFIGKVSEDLQKVVLDLYSNTQCNYTYRNIYGSEKLQNGIQADKMICAGSPDTIKDTCQGDSGGPLQIYHPEEPDISCMYDVVGITSFGQACGIVENIPGVYTKVANYIKWIEDIVWP